LITSTSLEAAVAYVWGDRWRRGNSTQACSFEEWPLIVLLLILAIFVDWVLWAIGVLAGGVGSRMRRWRCYGRWLRPGIAKNANLERRSSFALRFELGEKRVRAVDRPQMLV
jgi:hypothetical protein